MENEIDRNAKIIIEYLKLNQEPVKSDVIIATGVLDTRVAERAAELFLDGYGEHLLMTGGFGRITKNTNQQSEAETFRDVAMQLGASEDKIILEKSASNSGENARFSEAKLNQLGIHPTTVLVVTKPYMERRMLATFNKQWKNKETKFSFTSPQFKYEDFFNEKIPKDTFLNVLVGDLQRMKVYEEKGFQVHQDIPDEVWLAFEKLVQLGFNKSLIEN